MTQVLRPSLGRVVIVSHEARNGVTESAAIVSGVDDDNPLTLSATVFSAYGAPWQVLDIRHISALEITSEHEALGALPAHQGERFWDWPAREEGTHDYTAAPVPEGKDTAPDAPDTDKPADEAHGEGKGAKRKGKGGAKGKSTGNVPGTDPAKPENTGEAAGLDNKANVPLSDGSQHRGAPDGSSASPPAPDPALKEGTRPPEDGSVK